jgi:probable rRNA maturation factor
MTNDECIRVHEFGYRLRLISIDITNEQSLLPLDRKRLRAVVRAVLQDASVKDARISLAVVDDPTIARLNEQFLEH